MRGLTLRLPVGLGLSGVDFLRFGMGVGVFSESILGCMALFQWERLDLPGETSPSGMGPIEL
jgi:hypothetical protein